MSVEASKSATEIITWHETFKRPSLQILGPILNWLIQWDKALLVRKCIAQHQFGSAKSAQAAFPAQLPVEFWAWNNKTFRLHLFPSKNFLQMNLCSQKFLSIASQGWDKMAVGKLIFWPKWQRWRTETDAERKQAKGELMKNRRSFSRRETFFLLFSAQISRGEFSPPVSMPELVTFKKSSPGGRKI